ncbi:MAG: LysE family translocator [Rikenellaceae bacterium]
MINDFLSFIIFFLVTSITPGPNNITSLSFSLRYGYRPSLPYMLGIISGVFCVFLSMATLLFYAASTSLAEALYWMRYLGAAYILYLAYKTLIMNISWNKSGDTKPRFTDGFIFQAINPKLYFFSTTVLSTFVNYDAATLPKLFLLSLSVSTITFICISIWALAGAMLKVKLQNPTYKAIFGGAMALSLVYIAYRIIEM